MKIHGEIREFREEMDLIVKKEEEEKTTDLQVKNLHAYAELWPDAKKAVFDDRVEIIQKDNTKLIDSGNSLSVAKGQFISDEEAATMLVNAALAKGWKEVVIETDNETIRDYAQAIALGLDIEAHTAKEWIVIIDERKKIEEAEAKEAAEAEEKLTDHEETEINQDHQTNDLEDDDFQQIGDEDDQDQEQANTFTALASTAVAVAEKAATNNIEMEME